MREATERSEAIESGTARMVGSDTSRIISEVSELLLNETKYRSMSSKSNPFGDGLASKRIIEILNAL